MDQLSLDVLTELCRSRVTRSVVSLAADLAARRRISERGDPVGLTIAVVEDLCRSGLVTYTEGARGLPIDIRVTKVGEVEAGYSHTSREVGRGSRMMLASAYPHEHRPDPTDFMGHTSTAPYSEVERMHITDHVVAYPDHADKHRGQLEEMDVTRRATNYTDEEKEEALGLIDGGMTQSAVSRKLGIPVATISSWRGSPLFNGEAESLRRTIRTVLAQEGPIGDSRDLPGLLKRRGRYANLHDVQRMLADMERAGEVTMTAHRNGQAKTYGRIALARHASDPSTTDLGRIESAEISRDDDEHVSDAPAPLSEPIDAWPKLAELRERQTKTAKLRAAASILDGVDDGSARSLREQAELNEALLDIEEEYMAYAARYPREVES